MSDAACSLTLQEIRRSGVSGYKYISVDEDEATDALYCNNTLVHLGSDQIPKGFAVSMRTLTDSSCGGSPRMTACKQSCTVT